VSLPALSGTPNARTCRHIPVGSTRQQTTALQRQSRRVSRQDRWADDRAWTVSWMSLNRIDQNPGRGSGSSCRDRKKPTAMTTAAASQMITPTARTHGEDPNDNTMRPAIATASPTYPTRSAQTAILQCPLNSSSDSSSMPGIVPECRMPNGRGAPVVPIGHCRRATSTL